MEERNDLGWVLTILAGAVFGAILGAVGGAAIYPTLMSQLNEDSPEDYLKSDGDSDNI